MKKNLIISVNDYAKMQGVTKQAITKRLRKNLPLPGIKYAYKSGAKTSHYILIMEN